MLPLIQGWPDAIGASIIDAHESLLAKGKDQAASGSTMRRVIAS